MKDTGQRKRLDRNTANSYRRPAKVGGLGMILFWLIGIPIPVLLLFYLLQGC